MHPLDNVIWHALTTRQSHFAEGSAQARKFVREVSPLGALQKYDSDGYASLTDLLSDQGTVGLFLDEAYAPRPGWTHLAGAPLLQMICNGTGSSTCGKSDPQITELGPRDSPEMIALATLTKPGPFDTRTHEFGTYLGIRCGGQLVAMAGERLRVPGHTEVSAVCTHPDHTGKGYAALLMIEVMKLIRERGEAPFLHVRQDNTRAIDIYRRLGFRDRWRGYFAVLRREDTAESARQI